MNIKLIATQKWYAKERNIKIDEFDDYDAHVCRVANAYGNVVKDLTTPVVIRRFCGKDKTKQKKQNIKIIKDEKYEYRT